MLLAQLLLIVLGGCAGPDEGDRGAAQESHPADSHARAPALDGPWVVRVYATDPADPGVSALAEGLGTPVRAWAHDRLAPPRGEAAVVWLAPFADLDAAVAQLGGEKRTNRAGGAVVVVVGPGDSAFTLAVEQRLSGSSVSVVDPAAAARLWADPGSDPGAGMDAQVAGRAAARLVADHYGVTYTPWVATLPPGLDAWLGRASDAGLDAADPRTRAATVYSTTRDSQAIPWPIDRLTEDGSVGVRLAVATVSWNGATLVSLAADPDPQVRARAADRLDDVPRLTRLLDDPSSVVRVVATDRLARLAATRPAEVEDALRRAAGSPDAYQRWKAAFGLGHVPGAADALLPLLADADIDVRREACRSLGRTRDPRAVAPLIAALADPNSFVRRWAALGLGKLGEPGAKAALRAARYDPTALVAAAAAEALTALGEPDVPRRPYVPPGPPRDTAELDRWLASPDATVRKDALKFLDARIATNAPGLSSQEQVARLLRAAADPDSEVRKSAVETLGWTSSAGPALLPFLDDPDPDVLVTTLDALRRAPPPAYPALVRLRAHPDAEVRLRAAEALAAAGPSDALAACLADPDERVRAAAAPLYPDRVPATEPAALVRAAAGRGVERGGAGAGEGADAWAAGVFAREDDFLHLRFSWNADSDRPASATALRPPVVRTYGHPNRE